MDSLKIPQYARQSLKGHGQRHCGYPVKCRHTLAPAVQQRYNARWVFEMRRSSYLLLAVLLVQLTGLRALCAPRRPMAHGCCPESTATTPPSPSTLPDCCLASLLNYQGSISETPTCDHSQEVTVQSLLVSAPAAARVIPTANLTARSSLPSVSPPLSPLSQSCLLLI